VLNSVLVLVALLYSYPKKLLSINTLHIIRNEAIKPEESNFSKALSLGFGIFMGIIPLWGFQLLIGIPLAVFFRMNKVLFIAAANISVPPMIPLILYGSYSLGQFLITGEIDTSRLHHVSIDTLGNELYHYVIGAVILAISAALLVFGLSFTVLKLFRKEPKLPQ
jgi:uncharacterized protein (DUF2062 family)